MEKRVTNQRVLLLNIARARKKVSIDEIQKLTGDCFNKKQIYNLLWNLKNRKLILQKEDGIILNISKLKKIKLILQENWESNWEYDWEVVKNVISH